VSKVFFGIPDGIQEGDIFPSRQALIDNRLHRSTQRGIDGNGTDGSAAIVISDGFIDDYDNGDEILYTGEGGNDSRTGRQYKDQSIFSAGNAGLILSMKKKLPVRVIRSSKHNSRFAPKHGYKFDGIYYVKEYSVIRGKDGYKIVQFKLIKPTNENINSIVKIGSIIELEYIYNGVLKSENRSIGIPNSTFNNISAESNYAKSLLGKKVGDDFTFGQINGTIKSIKYFF
jgi:hypothetical protein